eukprot:SAG11_NODE_501_length_8895_cov_12.129832_4_plen_149_part_00
MTLTEPLPHPSLEALRQRWLASDYSEQVRALVAKEPVRAVVGEPDSVALLAERRAELAAALNSEGGESGRPQLFELHVKELTDAPSFVLPVRCDAAPLMVGIPWLTNSGRLESNTAVVMNCRVLCFVLCAARSRDYLGWDHVSAAQAI